MGFGHGPELIILLGIALIVLGPSKIPEIAQMLGKGIRELRKASAELQQTFDVNSIINPPEPGQAEAPEAAPPPADPPVEHTIMPTTVDTAPAAASSASPLEPAPTTDTPAKPKRTRKRATPADAAAAIAAAPEAATALDAEPMLASFTSTTEMAETTAPAAAGPESLAPAAPGAGTASAKRRAPRRRAGLSEAPPLEASTMVVASSTEAAAPALTEASADGAVASTMVAASSPDVAAPGQAEASANDAARSNGTSAHEHANPELPAELVPVGEGSEPAEELVGAGANGAHKPGRSASTRRPRRKVTEPVTADASA